MIETFFPNKQKYSPKPKVIALGKFNSIHLGHKKILSNAHKYAKKNNMEFIIMLFTENDSNNIYLLSERQSMIKEYKPNYLMFFKPNKENFQYTHNEFMKWLKDINVKNIFVGENFKFGHKALGDVNDLNKEFNTSVFDLLKLGNKIISTTYLLELISKKDFVNFKLAKSNYFSYEGEVVKGKGNGKNFNMPTANINYSSKKIDIPDGIYYSYATYNGKRFNSLTSISNNPTLNSTIKTYETYLYDFDKDIYGDNLKIEIIEYMRLPIKFNSIDDLIIQLKKDKEKGFIFFK